ncbi:Transglutaminase-like superfamily protein [Pseudobythopirellula maris]|uniref:Transglutaminase-like superfamily protein n=1 Tax=Pseudobythopirellula maris TaxID=2527991 RepID=A0A5C5ZJW0_9BACT|nr:7TM domain-containing protein [Pseudobythopirellula maris]TWT87405.1 Transglutaminase-like superfamily protein [Pseudobythopirellula maris]
MSSRNLSNLTVVVLVLLGLVATQTRRASRQEADATLYNSDWRLTYSVDFQVLKPGTEVRIALPADTASVQKLNEEILAPLLTEEIRLRTPSNTRELLATAGQTGDYEVTAQFDLRLLADGSVQRRMPVVKLPLDTRQRYLRAEETLPVSDPKVQSLLQRFRSETATDREKIHRIYSYCLNDLQEARGEGAGDDVLEVINRGQASPIGRARTYATLCRASRFPARLVTGFRLEQRLRGKPHTWVEVFLGNHWIPFDPYNGHAWAMPPSYVPARIDGESIVNPPGDDPPMPYSTEFSMVRLPPRKSVLQSDAEHPSQVLNLTRLPVEMHEIMSLLLLLPFGALIVSFCRNVVGIQTFGVFSPALLAMSFIYAEWVTGIMVLAVVLVTGILGRSLLEHLRLLMVPRLSIVLTAIILFVVFGVSALDYLNVTPSAKAVLLPLVILTVMIERFYVTIAEDGLPFAVRLAAGTLLVSSFCYLMLRWDEVGRIVLDYPELHLFTIAAFVLIGRYTGYRLTELWRFSSFVENSVAVAGGAPASAAHEGDAVESGVSAGGPTGEGAAEDRGPDDGPTGPTPPEGEGRS